MSKKNFKGQNSQLGGLRQGLKPSLVMRHQTMCCQLLNPSSNQLSLTFKMLANIEKESKNQKETQGCNVFLFSLCSLVYHDLFRDPLNWSQPGEAAPEGPLKALRSMCRRTDRGSVTIALDSLSWLLCHIPCVTLCQALHALSQRNVDPGAGAVPPLFFTLVQLLLPKNVTLSFSNNRHQGSPV